MNWKFRTKNEVIARANCNENESVRNHITGGCENETLIRFNRQASNSSVFLSRVLRAPIYPLKRSIRTLDYNRIIIGISPKIICGLKRGIRVYIKVGYIRALNIGKAFPLSMQPVGIKKFQRLLLAADEQSVSENSLNKIKKEITINIRLLIFILVHQLNLSYETKAMPVRA